MPSCLKRNNLIFADLFKVSSSSRYLQLKSVFLVLYYTFVSIRNPSEEVLPYLYSIPKWDAGKPPCPHTTIAMIATSVVDVVQRLLGYLFYNIGLLSIKKPQKYPNLFVICLNIERMGKSSFQ